MMRMTAALGGIYLLSACGGGVQPTEHLAASMAAVQSAQTAGAANEPQAELHLKLAQEQIEQARHMMAEGENERADAMTIRAFNDAQLALALAREAQLERQYQRFAETHPETRGASSMQGQETQAPASPQAGSSTNPAPYR